MEGIDCTLWSYHDCTRDSIISELVSNTDRKSTRLREQVMPPANIRKLFQGSLPLS